MKIGGWSLLVLGLTTSGLSAARAEGFAVLEMSGKDKQEVRDPKLRLTGMELAVLRLAACLAADKDSNTLEKGTLVKHSVDAGGYSCPDPRNFTEDAQMTRRWYDLHGKTEATLTVSLRNGELQDRFRVSFDDLTPFGPPPTGDLSIRSTLAQRIAREEIDFWVKTLGSRVDARLKKAADRAVHDARPDPAEVKIENVAATISVPASDVGGPFSGFDPNSFGRMADGASKP